MAILSNLHDSDLLQLLGDGREDAFTEIYKRYWERLVATGYYYTRSKEAAEEVVNDVLMGVVVKARDCGDQFAACLSGDGRQVCGF
ncbi:RNA polymerase sigma factor [Puia sp. P3]|uniref:RNA polymerase sigma factor n=1 Tax=Puia sp. P3 TaxID=3423952 RepID=UPI003D6700D4